jgi:hypothetical protein
VSNNPLSSLVSATLIFFLLTLIISKQILKSNRWMYFFSAIFILKLVLSVTHYLAFIDPHYFISNGGFAASFSHAEYQDAFSSVSMAVNDKIKYGIFYFDSDSFWVSHPEIWNLISIPLAYLGCYVLTITPINIFFTSILSINMVLIAKNVLCLDDKKVSAVAWSTALFPMFLLADNFYRDQIGLGLISIGITLMLVSKSSIGKIISIGLTLFFSYILRTVYPVFYISAIFIYITFIYRKIPILKFLLLPILIVILYFAFQIGTQDDKYVSIYVNSSGWLYIPLKIIFGVIGPFPWTQFVQYKINQAFSYQLADYLLGIFQLSYLTLFFQNIKKLFQKKNLDIMTLFGFGIAISGFVTKQMHISYIAGGILLTLPWFFSTVSFVDFRKRLGWMFILLIFFNFVVSLLGNMGISSLWRQ